MSHCVAYLSLRHNLLKDIGIDKVQLPLWVNRRISYRIAKCLVSFLGFPIGLGRPRTVSQFTMCRIFKIVPLVARIHVVVFVKRTEVLPELLLPLVPRFGLLSTAGLLLTFF